MRRRVGAQEKGVWERVGGTGNAPETLPADAPPGAMLPPATAPKVKGRVPHPPPPPPRPPERPRPLDARTLDAGWDRRLAAGQVAPDFTLDLHGCTLDSAHARLDHGLALAMAQGARLVLLITGRPRPSDDHASRSERRGAIRAKFMDWLAAGPHASRIAAIRPAHPRHGGAGAVYLVLRRAR